VTDCGAGGIAFFSRSIRNGSIVVANNSDDDDDRVIEMTGGGGLLGTLVIDFYVNDDNDNDKEPRISIHTRATLLIVDELDTYTRMGAFLSLTLTLSCYYCYCSYCCCCCLLMVMRETESNDDVPGGRGTRRNATINRATRNRTDEHDNANVRTTAFFSF
jgi:hypothetical protein